MTYSDLASVPSDPLAPFTDQLRLAVAAYLGTRPPAACGTRPFGHGSGIGPGS